MQVQDVSLADSNDYITYYKLHFLVNTFIKKSDESSIPLIKQKYKTVNISLYLHESTYKILC